MGQKQSCYLGCGFFVCWTFCGIFETNSKRNTGCSGASYLLRSTKFCTCATLQNFAPNYVSGKIDMANNSRTCKVGSKIHLFRCEKKPRETHSFSFSAIYRGYILYVAPFLTIFSPFVLASQQLHVGTPKSSILIGFSIINHPFWGTPIFGNTHVASCGRAFHQQKNRGRGRLVSDDCHN